MPEPLTDEAADLAAFTLARDVYSDMVDKSASQLDLACAVAYLVAMTAHHSHNGPAAGIASLMSAALTANENIVNVGLM